MRVQKEPAPWRYEFLKKPLINCVNNKALYFPLVLLLATSTPTSSCLSKLEVLFFISRYYSLVKIQYFIDNCRPEECTFSQCGLSFLDPGGRVYREVIEASPDKIRSRFGSSTSYDVNWMNAYRAGLVNMPVSKWH